MIAMYILRNGQSGHVKSDKNMDPEICQDQAGVNR